MISAQQSQQSKQSFYNLKDKDGTKGRTYDHKFAKDASAINIQEVLLGMKFACLAITDDAEGTLEAVGKMTPWHIQVLGMITGATDQAHKKLSEILKEFEGGYILDRNISERSVSRFGHIVDVQGYIAHNDQDLVLAYRCTTTGFDWLTNISYAMAEFEPEVDADQRDSGCCSCVEGRWSTRKPRCHLGFYNDFLATLPHIEEMIEPHLKPEAPRRRLFISGYSLGAGVAVMAFLYFLFKYDWATLPHKLILVTAGGPRAVDTKLRDKVEEEMKRLRPLDKAVIARIVNRKDVVPKLPPESWGFRHLAKLVYITDAMEVLINPNLDEHEIEEVSDETLKEKVQLASTELKRSATSRSGSGIFGSGVVMMGQAGQAAQDFVEGYDKLLAAIPSLIKDHLPDLYLNPLERLWAEVAPTRLTIKSARALRNADIALFGDKSDPYVVCEVLGKPELQLRTPTIPKCLDPEWNFSGELDGIRRGDVLEFVVWDEDLFSGPDLLGKARLRFEQYRPLKFSGDIELTDTGNKDGVQSFITLEVS